MNLYMPNLRRLGRRNKPFLKAKAGDARCMLGFAVGLANLHQDRIWKGGSSSSFAFLLEVMSISTLPLSNQESIQTCMYVFSMSYKFDYAGMPILTL